MLDHIAHDDIVKPLRNLCRIEILHIHRKNLRKGRSDCGGMLIQLYPVEFCRRIMHLNLPQSCSAGAADFEDAEAFARQIHQGEQINSRIERIVK